MEKFKVGDTVTLIDDSKRWIESCDWLKQDKIDFIKGNEYIVSHESVSDNEQYIMLMGGMYLHNADKFTLTPNKQI